ncbi:MAG: hypothetical protein ACOCW2_01040, partial [Chitinivibrionales bacterium]
YLWVAMSDKRVSFFIDGFNLYHALAADSYLKASRGSSQAASGNISLSQVDFPVPLARKQRNSPRFDRKISIVLTYLASKSQLC